MAAESVPLVLENLMLVLMVVLMVESALMLAAASVSQGVTVDQGRT
jgi:hypothetical protein